MRSTSTGINGTKKIMKLITFCLLCIGVGVSANERTRRQAGYSFPGPRSDSGGYNRQAAAGYAPQQNPATYAEEQDDSELYQVPRRQFQAQPVQQQYAPAQPRAAAPAPPPVYEAPRAPAPAPRQSYNAPAPSPRKKASASTSQQRANKYGSAPQQALNGGADEEEEEQGPDPLTLLLQDSKFACGSKNDGYYADDTVNCQVFHYCVGGARHSWMCPEGTVFHQVHLNCVPDSQDICSQSPKFHFVNEYLYKPIDYQGPNNTARYSQRYYPDGYVVGDTIVPPGENHASRTPQHAQPPQQPQQPYRPQPQAQSYPAPAPAPAPVARQHQRQVAPAPPPPPPPTYNAAPPQHQSSYNPAPARTQRPSRPSRPSYQAENPQSYRAAPAPQAVSGPPSQQVSYQPVNQDNLYQPAAPARRPATPQRSAGYPAPPRQYRPSSSAAQAPSPAQYQSYGSNQAAGVQYDEDY